MRETARDASWLGSPAAGTRHGTGWCSRGVFAIAPGEVKGETPRSTRTAERYVAPMFTDGERGQFHEPGPPRNGAARPALRWRWQARGRHEGRCPAPRSRGAGPERPARSTRWRGGPLQPTGPRLRPTSTDPVPAPCLSCRGLATSTSTHRKARTNARHGRRNRVSRDSREGDDCRNTGREGVHRARLSTECQTASTHGRPEAGPPWSSHRCRQTSRGVAAVHGGAGRWEPAPLQAEIDP